MVRLRTMLLILGDITLLYASLALALLFRYEGENFLYYFQAHLIPFSLIFVIWLIVLYLYDFYELRRLKTGLLLARDLTISVTLGALVSILLFYLFEGIFNLTPKTNLFVFSIIFWIIDFLLRSAAIKMGFSRIKILAVGESPVIYEIAAYLKTHLYLGFDIEHWLKDVSRENTEEIKNIINRERIDFMILPQGPTKNNAAIVKIAHDLLEQNIRVINPIDFFELIFQKIPLEEMEEMWFLEKIITRRRIYDFAKRTIDIILSVITGIIFLPFIIIIAVLIKLTSPGTALYSQSRTGKNGIPFILYKFRTMQANRAGPLWTTKNDDRITPLGKILRHTHLDEVPQLYNILKGDISFIGPRAERVELTEYYRQLPHYNIRHVIKPGLTGWAQVNYRASSSLEEAMEKLRYDIFYIKNRSLILDILILLKTIRLFFIPSNN